MANPTCYASKGTYKYLYLASTCSSTTRTSALPVPWNSSFVYPPPSLCHLLHPPPIMAAYAYHSQDIDDLRSIMRTPSGSPSRDFRRKHYEWSPSGDLPFNAVSTRQVQINRHKDTRYTYAGDEYDRSSIKIDRDEARRLKLRPSVSIHNREEEVGDERDESHFPPRPNTPFPSNVTLLPSLMDDDSDTDSSGSSGLPTPVDEDDRALALAGFYPGRGFACPSSLSVLSSAAREDGDDAHDRMLALANFRANMTGPSTLVQPPAYPVHGSDQNDASALNPSGASTSDSRRYPGLSGGRAKPKQRKRAVAISRGPFSCGGFAMDNDEGALGGF
ncbi:hypothetical protein BXZ70DRAFT_1013241 [Cristinia sonorae]|uniref:Uncharacterized protein n=1 Tax=Cristinia sonorae TaxID=1940300 RepID=A0A8K0UDW5_9AGAR|nr:hypothetical protein BXZ70DRAFT_1013241 [Cristinia sonorae]